MSTWQSWHDRQVRRRNLPEVEDLRACQGNLDKHLAEDGADVRASDCVGHGQKSSVKNKLGEGRADGDGLARKCLLLII